MELGASCKRADLTMAETWANPPAWNDLQGLAARGDASAAYQLALLTASGESSMWVQTVDWLRQAANLGHTAAADQIALLDDWLDVANWPALPEPEPLCRGPVILSLPSLVPDTFCDWIRHRAEERVRPAEVFDETTGAGRTDAGRTNWSASFGPGETDLVVALVRHRISLASGVPTSAFEASQVLAYDVGQVFDWHVDYLDPDNTGFAKDVARRGQRIATCLVYLNDEFKGGETAFAANEIRHRGRKGDGLMWSNVLEDGRVDPATAHAGLPPRSGRKWVFSQWIRDRSPRL